MKTLHRIIDELKSRFSRKRGWLQLLVLAAVPAVFLLVPSSAGAAPSCDWYAIPCHAAHFMTWFFEMLTELMGFIIVLLVDALLRVASFDNFVNPGPSAVKFGWVITRDLSNMFFIVFLLIIAFSTIIGYEKYAYRSNLRRLLIMAVVINFSKTICGLFIDMSQVLLLSFVNGFKSAAAGNFLRAFQIEKLLKLSDTYDSYTFSLVIAMIFAFILAAVAACVMLVLLVILLFRIIMLWVLIILSPIAFLTSSFPLGSENYYAKWWGMFKANLTNGPVIAFFIWLALATAQQTGGQLSSPSEGWGTQSSVSAAETAAAGQGAPTQGASAGINAKERIPTEAGTADTILSMVIMICLLFAGLKFASEAQVMGSGFASTVRNKAAGYLRRPWTAPGVRQVGNEIGGAFRSTGGAAMNRVGTTLARVPIVGGIGRRLAASGEKLEEARRKEVEARGVSSSKDLARYNPTMLASAGRFGRATDGQKIETMSAITDNPKALEGFRNSGQENIAKMAKEAEALAQRDPTKRGAVDNFLKAAWTGVEDKTKREGILKKFSGEEARKYMKPEDLNQADNLQALSKNTLTDVLTNGKDDQKSEAMGALNGLATIGKLEPMMKEKRMTYADLPAEAYKAAGTGADDIRAGALAAAEKDSALMRKFTEDPKMRDVLAPAARANFAAATTDIEKAQKLATLSQLGVATAADFGTAPAGSPPGTPSDIEVGLGQLSAKALSDLERNTPSDNPAAQSGLAKILEAAMKNGSTDLVQAIQRSPNLSQHVPLTVSREAEKATSGYTNTLASTASSKVSDLERQRKAAQDAGDSFGALGFAAAAKEIRDFAEKTKKASKELATEEQAIAKHREDFGAAQKTGNTAEMARLAGEIKSALARAEVKKTALKDANGDLKAKV